MKNMFCGCVAIETLDISNFKTDCVTKTSGMFTQCHNLKNLKLGNFNYSSITDVNAFNSMFYENRSIEVLDLSGFDLSKTSIRSTVAMFRGCTKLKTIIVSDKFVLDGVMVSSQTFLDCTSLVGGAGTVFDPNHIDKEYARIDDPANDKAGYFTSIEQYESQHED